MTITTVCDPIQCLARLREHVRDRLSSDGETPREEILGAVCYGIAKLAVDPSGLTMRIRHVNDWAFVEEILETAERELAWEVKALRSHLEHYQQIDTPGMIPAVVLEHFVRWEGAGKLE